MKIAFITPSVSRSSGGIFEVEIALSKALYELGCDIEVYGQNDDNTLKDLPKWSPIKVYTFPSLGPAAFRYSPLLKKAVIKSDSSIAHLQVMWMYTSIVMNEWRKTKRPYLITIHGMLEPWALQNSKWKKKIVQLLYEKRCLKGASCIHAHTHKEYLDIRKFGLTNPVCIIPNGITIPDKKSTNPPQWISSTLGRKVLLFIGRLHEKKGIDQLLRAWAALNGAKNEWCVVIAGWGSTEYINTLHNLTKELKIENDVIYAGPQFDSEKHNTLSHADAFILPSYSEGLPMAVLEAWSYHLPALITSACNLPEAYDLKAAIKIEPNKKEIIDGLEKLFSMNDDEKKNLGTRGYQLVKEKFSWSKIACQMAAVYKWINEGGNVPDTVLLK